MTTANLSTTPEFISLDSSENVYPSPTGVNTTNNIYQNIRVYIEGVEVPFTSISISQVMNAYPTCELEIPPSPGLMEIARYYQPKIHIFFTDEERGGDRLLFWGHICASAYRKSRAGSGSAGIHFRCNHKNRVLRDILMYFGSPVENRESSLGSQPIAATIAMNSYNSKFTITTALQGITGPQTESKDELTPTNPAVSTADARKLPKYLAAFEQRLIGMPGAMVNMWNQVKASSCANPNMHITMLAMYMPLLEESLAYFKRLSGHYPVERAQQDDRIPSCPGGQKSDDIMCPPAYRTLSQSAVQTVMAISATREEVSGSGEMSSFIDMCEGLFDSMMYEILTLASPAEVPVDPTLPPGFDASQYTAIETVIKPQTPFYYSPICNVIFPRMFSAIDIMQEEESVPSRVVALHGQMPGEQGSLNAYFRGPPSIREALSIGNYYSPTSGSPKKYDLTSTMGVDFGVPGKYEQGRGVRPLQIALPWWLVLLTKTYNSQSGSSGGESWPIQGGSGYNNMLLTMKDWNQRYAIQTFSDGRVYEVNEKATLNPNSPLSDIQAYQRILFNSVDYEFTKTIVRSRQGTISGVFNPYIIPGYPMDVIDDSPNCPSFHGVCASVTHTITSNYIGSSISIVAATSYEELSQYYHPPLHPWLSQVLGMYNEEKIAAPEAAAPGDFNTADAQATAAGSGEYGDLTSIGNVASTILQNPKAKEQADVFYASVLGVGAADPSTMYDFQTGQAIPQMRSEMGTLEGRGNGAKSLTDSSGGDANDWLTIPGNLRLVSRNIEGKDSIELKFGYDFMDMTASNYSGATQGYSNPKMMSTQFSEPGESIFLDYKETEDFIAPLGSTPYLTP